MESLRQSPIRNWLIMIIIILIMLVGSNVYLLMHQPKGDSLYVVDNSDQKVKDIENYLDSISSTYLLDEQTLAKQENLLAWGCGPSSYALAKIINKKFFDNKLVINASYNNSQNPYEIVERFGLAQNGQQLVDHAWLEIYFKDKFLFVDPTIAQFGKINKIAYQVFTIGQSDLQDILKTQYNIDDIRLSILVPKVINRIPADQPPYPGTTISEGSIGYFLKTVEDRNSVNEGIEPAEWVNWVSFLTNKYIN